MDIAILISIIIFIILQIYIIFLIINNKNQKDHIYELKTLNTSIKELKNKNDIHNNINIKQNAYIEDSIEYIQNDLRRILKENTQNSLQLNHVYDRIQSMNNIMINKKTRGNFGEYQLNHLLSVYAGESKEIYEIQYKLQNNMIADVALRLPDEKRVLVIDSKFPLENYELMIQEDISDLQRNKFESLFKQSIKKHIDDINKKYINEETLESAVMFIPSEAIYFYICSNNSQLIEYAHKKHVLLTSPTTLLGVVFTLVNITKDMKRTKNIKELEKNIVAMFEDVVRLKNRLNKLESSLNALTNNTKEVIISADKIYTKIERIHDGYIDGE